MQQHIVAMGGGGFSMEPDNPLLDDFVLGLTGVDQPDVLFLPTASGDSEDYLLRFYRAFGGGRARPRDLCLFRREAEDLTELLCRQHVIYVGGGNTAHMLAIWRLHELDRALAEASRRGVVLCGLSAGSVCWFEGCVTDSFGPLQAMGDGLGLLRGSNCPHFDSEAGRRPAYHEAVGTGALPAGWACDDGCALHFVGGVLREAVSSRPGAGAYRVARGEGDAAVEEAIPVRYLGAP